MTSVHDITQLIGNTPLVKLNRLVLPGSATVFLKIESNNPGGSVKDRIGLAMIIAAEKSGELLEGGTIIEPTSGNTGIALAMVAAARGYKCILTMPETMSIERRQLLALYGAKLVLTPGPEGMTGAIKKAKELIAQTDNAFMPQQFENPINPDIHRKTTAQEIWSATDGNIDAFVCGVGTGGTISGVSEIIKSRKDDFIAIAVEPTESPIISGGQHSPHKIQGIGAGFIPKNLDVDLIDGIELVSTEEAFAMRLRLVQEEGILAGISTGASVCAALRIAQKLGAGKTVVTMMHDTGERYLSMD
ncbi:cysteine synthase A [methanotrophic endosymbiont of Bathymodiolus puteoserpentis (Logatchev)]|jgi:cysteine synthase A|uniref:cysteine synthase A n=1 Tax=methanotrophic endosymbiont of Bathymodiolus puteoserpentis (Logatchev) TaxID=343235 RepID=UPI0013C99C8D|nr:cysteine synthase A [methanotrophic endosymbiont of Bathymodiolus puteoserpentis (Logatchev)]SHE21010.1 Cysteine synthase [methanotrophic endosymbiont of Bathymodiolus puteoserpentis (Logatchev)]